MVLDQGALGELELEARGGACVRDEFADGLAELALREFARGHVDVDSWTRSRCPSMPAISPRRGRPDRVPIRRSARSARRRQRRPGTRRLEEPARGMLPAQQCLELQRCGRHRVTRSADRAAAARRRRARRGVRPRRARRRRRAHASRGQTHRIPARAAWLGTWRRRRRGSGPRGELCDSSARATPIVTPSASP